MRYLIFFKSPYSNPLSICAQCASAAACVTNPQAAAVLPLRWPSLWHGMDLDTEPVPGDSEN